ncbi:MAG: nitroreductase family deazaflavin-dependent oxidoreductase [Myxococcota bacterium]
MADWGWFSRLHRAVYERTGGRWMSRLAGIEMLLLTTTGRRSGLPRTTPLACFARGGEGGEPREWVVVGSNNGQERHPAWWLNLEAQPLARIQVGAERHDVRARLAEGEERADLWPWLVQRNPVYARYERRTRRPIPVVVLSPTSGGDTLP